MINRYMELNKSFGSPFVYCLTRRGFFSEINNLLNAVAFGLSHRRRIIVGANQFNDLAWHDLFATPLPGASIGTIKKVSVDWYISGVASPKFGTIQHWVSHRHNSRLPLWLPQMRLLGSVFRVKRELTQMFPRPLVSATFPEDLTGPFAAVHIRRGDKTEGYTDTQERLIVEGDHISPRGYIGRLRVEAPEIKSIFVMTDDYRMVEELEQAGPDYSIHTLCRPEQAGYRQPEFSSLDQARKTDEIRRLIAEVHIAASSSIFLGGFKSNVARFVPLWHSKPERCLSVDSWKSWVPI